MNAVINPSRLSGRVTPPASKSMMQRVCAGALLHRGKTIVINPGRSDDDKAALQIIQNLGAQVVVRKQEVIEIISGGIVSPRDTINCSESGLSARMFTPIAAVADKQVVITGSGSLMRRPMDTLQEILPPLGVKLQEFSGYLPITVHGPLQPKSIVINGSFSSQYLTGLLFAMTAAAKAPLSIEVRDLISKPYIDLTLDVLKQFGKKVTHEDHRVFDINPTAFRHKEVVTITVESDWSSAAFLLVAGAINGAVSVNGLNRDSAQADKAIIDVLALAGSEVQIVDDTITVTSERVLKAFEFDATNAPDLFPVLSILAACSEGESRIMGIGRLTHKESNRTKSICAMLEQFGVVFMIDQDTLRIEGQERLKSATINSFKDHRIAMAAAIGALRAEAAVTIIDADAISKSYPDFFKHLVSLGAQLNLKT